MITDDRSGVPKPEYPRPQFVRAEWLNLNGDWEFEVDRADTGLERGLLERSLNSMILVPFAPESTASGVGLTDFLNAVWYRRSVELPPAWAGRRVLLNFGAVDHDATVWVNGVEVGRHRGGFSSFGFDITDALMTDTPITVTTAVITVRARDPRDGVQARGKQATQYANAGCHYTRTTGIWQTVWLEPVPVEHLQSVKVTPVLSTHSFQLTASVSPAVEADGYVVEAELFDDEGLVAAAWAPVGLDLHPQLVLPIPVNRARPWTPQDPHLYELSLRLVRDGDPIDHAQSYAGLRAVGIRGRQLLLNGEPVFQRLVLDQGYWPDTLTTSPSDDALVADIVLALAAGFNGARLHQKVFEERFYFHADRLGYLVWAEFGDWGCSEQGSDGDNQQPTASYITQWLEVLRRDHNHPSIIGWCPLNETFQARHDRITQLDDVTQAMFWATKLADPSRPVIDASGYAHRVAETDVYDAHHYEQDPSCFAAAVSRTEAVYVNELDGRAMSLPYRGQPYFISEFGGIWWNAEALATTQDQERAESWGYGDRVRSLEEFYARFAGLVDVLLDDPSMFGYCYTQLTDVFQEENGLYGFDRRPKFDVDRIRRIQQRPAAYEVTGRASARLTQDPSG